MKRIALVLLVVMAILARPVPAEPPIAVAQSRLQLVEATVEELQLALRSHLITSEQLVQMYLDRIAAYDDAGPLLNSYIHLNEDALEEARARDLDRRRGRAHGPLFGIPVLLKDNIDTADMPTTAGSVALEGSIPPDDAFITQQAARGRRDHPRQGDADRVRELHRHRHALGLQLARRLRVQPVRPAAAARRRRASGAHARRLELGLRHRRLRQPGGGRDGHRDLGLDPQPRHAPTAWSASSRRWAW